MKVKDLVTLILENFNLEDKVDEGEYMSNYFIVSSDRIMPVSDLIAVNKKGDSIVINTIGKITKKEIKNIIKKLLGK